MSELSTTKSRMAGESGPARFLGLSFGCMLVLLIGIAALNFVIDPASIFQPWKNQSGRLERQIATALNSGSNVASSLYFDVPQMKIATTTSRPKGADILVIGSSRGMEIRPSLLGRKGVFFNAFVSSANLQDALAMYEACTDRHSPPSFVLFSIDPWIFNAGHPDIEWRSLSESYGRIADRLKFSLPAVPSMAGASVFSIWQQDFLAWLDKSKELISWGYTSESVKIVSQRWAAGEALFKPDYYLTHDDFSNLRVFRSDGSVGFEPAYRDRDVESIRQGAQQYARPPAFGLKDFSALDPLRCDIFSRFVGDLQSHGTEVVFYLPPYHPATYAEFMRNDSSRMVTKVEQYVRAYARTHHIKVYGSYDPTVLGCTEGEFYDATHVHASRVEQLLSDLRK